VTRSSITGFEIKLA